MTNLVPRVLSRASREKDCLSEQERANTLEARLDNDR